MRQMNQGQLWHDKQDHQWKTSICQWQANNIPKIALSKSSSLQAKIQQVKTQDEKRRAPMWKIQD